MTKNQKKMSSTSAKVKNKYKNTCVHCCSDERPYPLNDSHILQRSVYPQFKYLVCARIPLCQDHDRQLEWLPDGTRRPFWSRMIMAYRKSPRCKQEVKEQIRELAGHMREFKKAHGGYTL
jgi:hypothetical protein